MDCGGEISAFVNDKGIILTCGSGKEGALGHNNFEDVPTPKLIKDLLQTGINEIACGEAHMVAIAMDNKLYSWGNGESGRLGNGSKESQ